MGAFHKMISRLRGALETGADQSAPVLGDGAPALGLPVATAARHAELASIFARELEAVGGHFLGVLSPTQAVDRIAETARDLKAKTVAVGQSVVLDAGPLKQALKRGGLTVIGPENLTAANAQMRDELAQTDLGIAEAHYAIAPTGTLAVVAGVGRPNALTLLPPANIIVVHVERLMPDLASAIGALAAEGAATSRVSLITGPSRTADIEKRIVLGVHGPKQLYAAIVWPQLR